MNLLQQYEAVSFGDSLFACYVLIPLQQKHNLHLRKAVWTENCGILRILNLPLKEVSKRLHNILYIGNFSCREILAKMILGKCVKFSLESSFSCFKDSQWRCIGEFIFRCVYFWKFQGCCELSENLIHTKNSEYTVYHELYSQKIFISDLLYFTPDHLFRSENWQVSKRYLYHRGHNKEGQLKVKVFIPKWKLARQKVKVNPSKFSYSVLFRLLLLLLVWRSFKIFQEEIADITEQDHQIYFEFGPQDQNHLWYFWKCKHVMCTWQGQSAEIKPCF